MSGAACLQLRSFSLGAGGSLDLWLPSDPDGRVRRAQSDPTEPASDLLGFWATLWPCAITTAHLVSTTSLIGAGTRVLEVGCGVGLAGLACGLRGADVTLTDGDPEGVALVRRNIEQNRLDERCQAAVFRWEQAPDPVWEPELILGCDVLYDPVSHGLLARLVAELGCAALLTDPQRATAAPAAGVFREHGLGVWESTGPGRGGGCAVRVLLVQPG